MGVQFIKVDEEKNKEFAALFEESTAARGSLKQGEIVKGKIVGITRDVVIIDIGFKSEGQVEINEFMGPHREVRAKVGDEIEVMLDEIEGDDGMLKLSKERADAVRTWDRLAEVVDTDGEIEGLVLSKVKGGLSVDIGVRAFLPGSQIDLRPSRNLDRYIGQSLKFKIIKLNKRRGNVVLSRKSILEKEREQMRKDTLSSLSEGQVFDGIVKNVTDYGLFVDLGGIDGLLHVTDMSWSRINHPSELYKAGDTIRVVVLKYDPKEEKVSLGLKQLQSDPWQDVEDRFTVGSRVHGKVVSLTDYGAFVALNNGVEGLIHISEMSWSKKLKHPSKVLSVGQEVDAVVLDIDTDARRISLGIKQIMPNPWDELENKYSLGAKLEAEVRNIADFGLFVDVGADIDGLIHISDIAWVQNFAHPSEVFKKGDKLQALVLQIDPENERFSLGLKQMEDDPWERIDNVFKTGTAAAGKVVSINPAGAVVELEEGVQALLPKEQCNDQMKVGAEVNVKVASANSNDRQFRVNLA